MTWTKVGSSTNSFVMPTGATDQVANNAYAVDSTGVIQEYIAFIETRGWTCQYQYDSATTTHEWLAQKNVLCEDGSSVVFGFAIYYNVVSGAGNDVLKVYNWNPNTSGVSAQDLTSASTLTMLTGRWGFWVSDEDSDSFAVITSGGATSKCIGFQPHAGELFAQYEQSTYNNVSGIKILTTSSFSWESAASSGLSPLLAAQGTIRGGADKMNPTAIKTDFVWLTNSYDRPVMRSAGTDIELYLNPNLNSATIFGSNLPHSNNVMKFGDNYYIATGDQQRLLLNCGTVPPIF